MSSSPLFPIVFGRELIGELPQIAHRPYLVVTMADLWPRFRHLFDAHLAGVHSVDTLEYDELMAQVQQLPTCSSIIGLGGGQAIDVAKFVAWTRRLPLFQVPTATSVDAPFGHRSAIRFGGQVRYIGWAVPEAVYVDYDVIRSAPPLLNRSGIGDILCYHTAHFDWRLAHARGRSEAKWPYDPALVAEAQQVLEHVIDRLDDIHAVSDEGIRTLMEGLAYGGAAYHNAGWNPRHVEGSEHFFFYTLEYLTGQKFIHGQSVCLGIFIASTLQENHAAEMLDAIHAVGVDIRPQAMGLTWDTVAEAMFGMAEYVRQAGLWYTIIDERPVTPELVAQIREQVEEKFGSR